MKTCREWYTKPPGGKWNFRKPVWSFSLAPPYIIGSVTGTGGPETTVISSSVPGVDGVFVHGIRTESREVTCFIHVDGEDRKDNVPQAVRTHQETDPGQEPGLLYYFNDYTVKRIAAFPQSSPSFTERIQNCNRAELRSPVPVALLGGHRRPERVYGLHRRGIPVPVLSLPSISFAALRNRTSLTNAGFCGRPGGDHHSGAGDQSRRGQRDHRRTLPGPAGLAEGETLQIRTKRGEKSVKLFRAGRSRRMHSNTSTCAPHSFSWSPASMHCGMRATTRRNTPA